VHESSKGSEHADKVSGRDWTGLRWQIFGEKAVSEPCGDQKEKAFPCKEPEEKTRSKKNQALGFTERLHCLASVKDPNWNEIQNV
jgi:hypothetical protein